ncbi:phage major capsid protein [Listeria sp. FSL L7-1582]|uniref:phage major capsid protein n=1 Tax=Listeria portnoyi TaxID=2713504 RepID=UPI00164E4CBB|nr:phage major capsid protein [Listeria portnoyi]MBC6310145.1 phage major capsid protein [Listeria portnoyi]
MNLLKEKLKEAQKKIAVKQAAFNTKVQEATKSAEDGDLTKASAYKKEAETIKAELDDLEAAARELRGLAQMEPISLSSDKKAAGQPHLEPVEPAHAEVKAGLNDFLHSKGATIQASVTSTDVGVLIPEEIQYTPRETVETTVRLKDYVHVVSVTTPTGKYPVLANPTTTMASVAELEKNPELAKPTFNPVAWEVETYRGAIPLSQESIDDSAADLVGIVARDADKIKVNTENQTILTALKTLSKKTVTTFDEIKDLVNVSIDPGYTVRFTVTQSFFNVLDKLKDNNGRYLLQDDIKSVSGKALGGLSVLVVPDKALGTAGSKVGFIGDLYAAILFTDRKELALKWVDNEIYGQYLAAVTRFGVSVADKNAGYFVTYDDTVVPPAE